MVSASGSATTGMRRRTRLSAIASVSSAVSAPSMREVPSASAAATSARFVKLRDPGTRTVAFGGAASGSTSYGSVMAEAS